MGKWTVRDDQYKSAYGLRSGGVTHPPRWWTPCCRRGRKQRQRAVLRYVGRDRSCVKSREDEGELDGNVIGGEMVEEEVAGRRGERWASQLPRNLAPGAPPVCLRGSDTHFHRHGAFRSRATRTRGGKRHF